MINRTHCKLMLQSKTWTNMGDQDMFPNLENNCFAIEMYQFAKLNKITRLP